MPKDWTAQISHVNFRCGECRKAFEGAPDLVEDDAEQAHHPYRYFAHCPHCGAPQNLPSAEPPGTLWLPVPALIVGILALLAAIGLADSALIDPDEYVGTLLFAGIAIILGAIGTYQQKKGRALSIAGLVLGGLALLISLGV